MLYYLLRLKQIPIGMLITLIKFIEENARVTLQNKINNDNIHLCRENNNSKFLSHVKNGRCSIHSTSHNYIKVLIY